MRVLIFGSRTWTDEEAILRIVLALPTDTVVIHGGAEGADQLAHRAALHCGLEVKVFCVSRAEWDWYGKAAGPRRNQRMIDEGQPDLAYGFRARGESTGTDDMLRRLRKAGIRCVMVYA